MTSEKDIAGKEHEKEKYSICNRMEQMTLDEEKLPVDFTIDLDTEVGKTRARFIISHLKGSDKGEAAKLEAALLLEEEKVAAENAFLAAARLLKGNPLKELMKITSESIQKDKVVVREVPAGTISSMFRTKADMYNFLKYSMRVYLPKPSSCSTTFMLQLIRGTKKPLMQSDIKPLFIPGYRELRISEFETLRTNHQVFEYLPDKPLKDIGDKTYCMTVLATILGDTVKDIVNDAIQKRIDKYAKKETTICVTSKMLRALEELPVIYTRPPKRVFRPRLTNSARKKVERGSYASIWMECEKKRKLEESAKDCISIANSIT